MPPKQAQKQDRAGQRLLIVLSRRDVHNFALLRRRLYDITESHEFVVPDQLVFLLTIVDTLFRTVEHGRKAWGFTWNTPSSPEEVGLGSCCCGADCVGAERRKPDESSRELRDALRGPAHWYDRDEDQGSGDHDD